MLFINIEGKLNKYAIVCMSHGLIKWKTFFVV